MYLTQTSDPGRAMRLAFAAYLREQVIIQNITGYNAAMAESQARALELDPFVAYTIGPHLILLHNVDYTPTITGYYEGNPLFENSQNCWLAVELGIITLAQGYATGQYPGAGTPAPGETPSPPAPDEPPVPPGPDEPPSSPAPPGPDEPPLFPPAEGEIIYYNELGQPFRPGIDTVSYWYSPEDNRWYRGDLQGNITEIWPPPWRPDLLPTAETAGIDFGTVALVVGGIILLRGIIK